MVYLVVWKLTDAQLYVQIFRNFEMRTYIHVTPTQLAAFVAMFGLNSVYAPSYDMDFVRSCGVAVVEWALAGKTRSVQA